MPTSKGFFAMKKFSFTLVLAGVKTIDQKTQDELFEAGCDDALLFSRDGKVYLDFSREAASLSDAIKSAIQDIEKTGRKADVFNDRVAV